MRHTTFTDERVSKEIKTTGTLIFLTCDKKIKITSQTPYQAPAGLSTTLWELLSWGTYLCSNVYPHQPRIVLVLRNVSIWYRITSTQDSNESTYCPTAPPLGPRGPVALGWEDRGRSDRNERQIMGGINNLMRYCILYCAHKCSKNFISGVSTVAARVCERKLRCGVYPFSDYFIYRRV
jgi:hypothetical protein